MFLITFSMQTHHVDISKAVNNTDSQIILDIFTGKYTHKWLVKQKMNRNYQSLAIILGPGAFFL